MQQVREELHDQLGPLGQKYNMLLGGDREKRKSITFIYMYTSETGTMLCDKKFDLDTSDFVIIDEVKYKGTWVVRINFQKNSRHYLHRE